MRGFGLRSVDLLMRAPVLGAAVEHLVAHEAFAARKMDAALLAAHHVLAACAPRAALRASNFSSVALEYPVNDNKGEHQHDKFSQAPIPANVDGASLP